MEVKLDKFGRVLIPKRLRDRLGLGAGARLRVDADDDRIELRPADTEPALIEEEGLLVFTGSVSGDLEEVLREVREVRIRELGGR